MRPATPKQKALLEYLGLSSDVSMEDASDLIGEATSNSNFQEKLDRWQLDRLRLHPQLYAKEVASAKAGRSEALWREANSEYGSICHPLKRITKGQAADAVRYLDQHYSGWDNDLFQLYWTLNIDVVHDYFFPAIKATHPKAIKVTLSDQVDFRSQHVHGPRQAWSLPVAQPKRDIARSVVLICLLVILGMVVWLILNSQKFQLITPTAESPKHEQNNISKAAPPEKSLTEMRIWTDSNGRTLQARLISISKGTDGLYIGQFQRPNDEEFAYHIGLLSKQDIELVKALAQKLAP